MGDKTETANPHEMHDKWELTEEGEKAHGYKELGDEIENAHFGLEKGPKRAKKGVLDRRQNGAWAFWNS